MRVYIFAAYFEQMLMSAPWIWPDNSAKTFRSCAKDCAHKL